ncbi:unspecific monooxygenase [Ranunculus cassubicifolius]
MFSAGTDILSATLVWAMTELIRHLQIMKDIQREIRELGKGKPFMTEDDLGNIPYLKLVLKETLRLHPPTPLLVPRESIEPTTLQGYDIPAKTRVIVNAWAIGRDPIKWEEPEEFQPRRFLNKPVDYKGTDFEMIPFGGGGRECPGVLFTLFDWNLPGNATRVEDIDIAESFGILVNKTSPLLLVATPHSSK